MRYVLFALTVSLAAGCTFDTSGPALEPPDSSPDQAAPDQDFTPVDVAADQLGEGDLAPPPPDRDVVPDREPDRTVVADRGPDNAVVPDQGSDKGPGKPDLPQVDLSQPDMKADLKPGTCAKPCGQAGNPPICCDKGSGWLCQMNRSECICSGGFKVCGGSYPTCCVKDKVKGLRCYSDPSGCGCTDSNKPPCAASHPICCQAVATPAAGRQCRVSSAGCLCNSSPTGYNPCTGAQAVCCKKVGEPAERCHADSANCICSGLGKGTCGGAYPVCCKKKGDSETRCHADAKNCICTETLDPCTGAYPVCCVKTAAEGMICHPGSSGCACQKSNLPPCGGQFTKCCKKAGDTVERCYSTCP